MPNYRRRRPRGLREAGVALIAGVGVLLASAPALAAPVSEAVDAARISVQVPQDATELWVAVEGGGTQSANLSVVMVEDSAGPTRVAMRETSFGSGAVLPRSADQVDFVIASGIPAEPDISITSAAQDGTILSVEHARVSLSANPETDPDTLADDSTPVVTPPTADAGERGTSVGVDDSDRSASRSDARSRKGPSGLAASGSNVVGLLLVTAAVGVVGMIGFFSSRWRSERLDKVVE